MVSTGASLDTRTRIQSWIALGVVYVVWGSTYLAIRVGVGHLPPLLLAGTRYVIAGALLYPIARRASAGGRGPTAGGRARPGARAWLAGAIVGVLLLFAGNGGVSVGRDDAALGRGRRAGGHGAALDDRLRLAGGASAGHGALGGRLAIGLGGVAILVGASLSGGGMSGVFIVLGASAAWGFGSVLSHRLPVPGSALLAAAIEMLAGGVVLLAVAAATGEFGRVHWSAVPVTAWIALAYLIGPGSILAFTAYGYALSHLPTATVSTYAYVNPVVAVLAGIVFLGEQFTWREGVGAALVLASVVITLNRPHRASAVAEDAGQQLSEVGTLRG